MYQLRLDNYILYDPRDESLNIRNPSVHLAVGEAGNVDFTVDNSHPCITALQKMKGTLELVEDGYVLYRGRITKDTRDFDNSRIVESEGLLACLNDSVIPPYTFPDDFLENAEYQEAASSGNVVEYFLGWVLEQHNSQVGADRQIQLGSVTVTDNNNYISRRSGSYTITWELMKSALPESSLGGYFIPRYDASGTYLDYYAEFPYANLQPIAYGENLLDISNDIDASSVYTAILPLGRDGLTISGLLDGDIDDDLVKIGALIYSKSGREMYGNITRPVTWDDITDPDNLKTKGASMLVNEGLSMVNSISIRACDLHCTDDTISGLRIGRKTMLKSKPHGYDKSYPLMELDLDILDPGNTVITLGSSIKTQTDINRANSTETAQHIINQQMEINQQKSSVDELSQGIKDANNNINTVQQQLESSITQTSESISGMVSRIDTTDDMVAELSTRMTQTAEGWVLDFNRLDTANSENSAVLDQYKAQIKLTNGKIVLLPDGGQVSAELSGDRLSFMISGTEVAFLSNDKLHITNARILEQIIIGKFMFAPRENGNLSFKRYKGG